MHPRHSVILELVNSSGRVSVVDLSTQLGVSEVTIRQDLTQLENQGFLKRVHGAATVLDSEDPEHRLWANQTFTAGLILTTQQNDFCFAGT